MMRLVALSALLLAACGGGDTRLAAIQPGMTRAEVRARLGEPDQITRGDTCALMGPAEGACAAIQPSEQYEEWRWDEARPGPDLHHYVYFGARTPADPAAWRVVYTTTEVEGTVY